jgi:hypothetical protein
MPEGSSTRVGGGSAPTGAARHERPAIDDAALAAARAADHALGEARDRGADRWVRFLEPLPDRLRDDGLTELRGTALRCRAAFGPKDSIRDALSADVTEPLLEAVDRLLKLLVKRDASGS